MDFISCFVAAESGFYGPATHLISVSSNSQKSLFQTIPPERVGLQGEYDYYGLTKRVELALRQHFQSEELGDLWVKQRGAVVLLQTGSSDQFPRDLLRRIADIALQIEGATGLEFNGKTLDEIFSIHESPRP